MEAKDALTGTAVAVLMAVFGLIVIVGVILLMMWLQPGIAHSPSQQSRLLVPHVTTTSLDLPCHHEIMQLCNVLRSDA